MQRERAVDSLESTSSELRHWKGRFKAAAGAFEVGEVTEARELVFRALMEAERLEESYFAVPACNVALGVISTTQDKLKEAKEYFDKGLGALASRPDDACQELYGAGLRLFAQWYEKQEQFVETEACLKQSVEVLKPLSSPVQLAYSLCDLGFALVRTGRAEEAEPLVYAAMDLLLHSVGEEHQGFEWAKMIYQSISYRGDEESLCDVFEMSATKMQYKSGAHHPNLLRALGAYAPALKKRGLTDKLEHLKSVFLAFLSKEE